MIINLQKIDSAPIAGSEFDYQFLQWLWVLVDSLNGTIGALQLGFNPSYTQAQITAMNTAGQLNDGVVLYDTTNNVYVGRQSGALVKFTTAAYP